MLLKDFAFAWRTLRKDPLFTFVAVLTIALGIGASTAIFSVVNAVLLRPLPYANPDRLVLVWGDLRARDVTDFPFSAPDFRDLREQGTLFADLAAVWTARQPYVPGSGEPVQMRVALVTPNVFRVLGVPVAAGRDFTDADAEPQPPPEPPAPGAPAAPPSAPVFSGILSHEFWQHRLGGDPAIVGRVLDIGGGRAHIVGVAAPRVELLLPTTTNVERTPDIWIPARLNYEQMSRIQHFMRVIGRLDDGVTVGRAQAQVDVLAAKLRKAFPIKETSGLHFRVEPMNADLVADVRPALLALMGAVAFVLLIACANVANLLLVRASQRERQLAVRAALGGSRWRLVRQLLAESFVIAGGGALAGLLLADIGIDTLLAMAPANLPRADTVSIDPNVLAFTAAVALTAAVAFGLILSMRASRPDVLEVLRTGGRSAGLGGSRLLQNAVVVVEVALAFILLVGSGLMLRSFVALHRIDLGFDPGHVLTFVVQNFQGQTPEERAAFMRDDRSRLEAVPGVEAVTAAGPLPLDGTPASARWGTEEALTDPNAFQQATVHVVLPGYFETMRGRLVAGRTFTEADNLFDRRVIIIDDRLAARAFPNEPAVGTRLLARPRTPEPEWFEVIGVVAHQRHLSIAEPGPEAMFFTDGYMGFATARRWAVRAAGDPASLGPHVRAAVARLNPRLVVSEMQPMQVYVDRAQAPTGFAFTLIAAFAVIALLLAAVGLYGVLATAVRQRTPEIGVRMAFGAPRAAIVRLVVGQGLILGAAGVALGLFGALGLTRVMSSLLVGVTPSDPPTYATIAALFLVIAAIATWLPARHAARLDPNEALRME